MNRRVWVIAAPGAVLVITFLLFALLSLNHSGAAQAAKAQAPAASGVAR
ncbi:MAG: hypothetical protein JSR45_17605 [Proteobacteria bacterium]|nr:hypothetical protein [Pseudomonadota bacterium]